MALAPSQRVTRWAVGFQVPVDTSALSLSSCACRAVSERLAEPIESAPRPTRA